MASISWSRLGSYLTGMTLAVLLSTRAAESTPAETMVFYLPLDGSLVALSPAGSIRPVTGAGMTGTVAFVPGLSGQAARIGAVSSNAVDWYRNALLYPADWMKTQEQGTIALWYQNPRWAELPWQVPALVTPAQWERSKTSAFQTPLSWWIFDRLTAPPEQGESRWHHWEIVTKGMPEHPRNIRPRDRDDGRWHFWALRWNRADALLEVLDDDQVRDISSYENRIAPGGDHWVETYNGRTTDVYETVGKIRFDEIFLGHLQPARSCEVTLDELVVWDRALAREALVAAYRRGLAGEKLWPAEAYPVPGSKVVPPPLCQTVNAPGPALSQVEGPSLDRKLELKKGDRIVVAGDSITFMKKYSIVLALYLTACYPDLSLSVVQNSVYGEETGNYRRRLQGTTLDVWRPTVVTLCYGMNDGRYTAYSDFIGYVYETNLKSILDCFRKAGVRVLVGSPGIISEPGTTGEPAYNAALRRMAAVARAVADAHDVPFADIHQSMLTARDGLRRQFGNPAYDLIGRDGLHADWPGQMAMACAFLDAMGLTNTLGAISLDADAGTATAENGHAVTAADRSGVTLASTRSVFTFPAGAGVIEQARQVAEVLQFDERHNELRFTLKTATPGRYEVKWESISSGTNPVPAWTRDFDSGELERGVNLARMFRSNPFVARNNAIEGILRFKAALEDAVLARDEKSQVDLLKRSPSVMGIEAAAGDEPLLERVLKLHARLESRIQELARAPLRHRIAIRKL